MAGKFYGIGVGPGDPELLTLKACRVLKDVDVLAIPKSRRERRSIALEIVAQAVEKEWQIKELLLPMTQELAELKKHWKMASQEILELLNDGKDVAFVTLGDPTIYSTFTYLMKGVKELAPDVKVEIVPGISAINAMSAWVQKPLSEGDENLAVIPAIRSGDEIKLLLERFDNLVLMKAGKQFKKVYEVLKETGLDKKATFISRCGFSDGFYTENLEELEDKNLDYLSSILIKKNSGGEE
ncbi:MAG: Cobalt-precorrin-2 C20-methyltransferase [Clostridiales bacterium]|nr:Cobalt-precorrin-2 C20-methyltransferase [Clostridiales bacterium]